MVHRCHLHKSRQIALGPFTQRPPLPCNRSAGGKLAEERAKNPADDIISKLVTADIDGHKLNDDEFGYFVILLAVAGNETTRNAITHGMNAFFNHPDQWELYKQTRARTAPDEIVRWIRDELIVT